MCMCVCVYLIPKLPTRRGVWGQLYCGQRCDRDFIFYTTYKRRIHPTVIFDIQNICHHTIRTAEGLDLSQVCLNRNYRLRFFHHPS